MPSTVPVQSVAMMPLNNDGVYQNMGSTVEITFPREELFPWLSPPLLASREMQTADQLRSLSNDTLIQIILQDRRVFGNQNYERVARIEGNERHHKIQEMELSNAFQNTLDMNAIMENELTTLQQIHQHQITKLQTSLQVAETENTDLRQQIEQGIERERVLSAKLEDSVMVPDSQVPRPEELERQQMHSQKVIESLQAQLDKLKNRIRSFESVSEVPYSQSRTHL